MRKTIKIYLLAFMLYSPLTLASNETLEKIDSRGVEQKFVLTAPEAAPVASVILLAGGHGKLDIHSTFGSVSFGWGKNNNLVRTRQLYADEGFLVATIDAPSDKDKMNAIWRMSEEHAADIQAVATYLKNKADVPVWVIGTSMGSFSAANAGIRSSESINGIVLTSSVTKSRKKWSIADDYPNGIIDMELSKVTVPVLVVSHQDDKCKITPAKDIDLLAGQFKSSSKVEKALFAGGDAPESKPCKGLSAHGFLGIERKAVKTIADFIKLN